MEINNVDYFFFEPTLFLKYSCEGVKYSAIVFSFIYEKKIKLSNLLNY